MNAVARCLNCTLPPEACDNGCRKPKPKKPKPRYRPGIRWVYSEDMPDGPDGTHALDHFWITAPWRVDGQYPVVRVMCYIGQSTAQVGGVDADGTVFIRAIAVKDLEWCRGG